MREELILPIHEGGAKVTWYKKVEINKDRYK
jgi:hypothetical protein